MSVLGAILSLSSGTYTVTRRAKGTLVRGRYVPSTATPTTFDVVASVQPVTGRDTEDLPEGIQTKDLRKVYTATELRTNSDGQEPDSIEIDGEPWTVVRVARWDAFGEQHWQAFASRNAVRP